MSTCKRMQLLGTAGLAAAGLAAAATISAPAHASCISISGLGNGNGTDGSSCTSGLLGIAVGIGPNTVATSDGLLAGAVAVGRRNSPTDSTQAIAAGFLSLAGSLGTDSSATTGALGIALGIGPSTFVTSDGPLTGAVAVGLGNSPTDVTQAFSTGFLSLSAAVGTNVQAGSQGRLALALAQGRGSTAGNSILAQAGLSPTDNVNVAVNVLARATPTSINRTLAIGDGNLAANIGGDSTDTRNQIVQAFGLGNIALNGRGDGNQVSAGNLTPGATDAGVPAQTPSTLGLAFNTFGNNNTATAIGPLAVAGSVLGNGRNDVGRVLQTGPGIALNRNRIGPTTAATHTSTPLKRIGATRAGSINSKTVAGKTKNLARAHRSMAN